MIVAVCLVQALKQFIQQFQDFGGQQVAESSQIAWDVFVSLLHIP